jgi:hypothetical protein
MGKENPRQRHSKTGLSTGGLACPTTMKKVGLSAVLLLLIGCPLIVLAGPPFTTDDPVPVDYQNWEFFIASQNTKTDAGWSGTAPHLEINYGIITNVQLHLITPMVYDAPKDAGSHYGYGDTEVGVKFRFFQESEKLPQAGTFPSLQIPTGNASEGLGSGHVQAFLPLWLQKSFADWAIYGGGGYGINPGAGNENWGFVGGVLQYQVATNLLVGGEIYHKTATESGGRDDTAFNLGTVIDFNAHHHLLFSAGRSIDGPTEFQGYLAYQFTFGPELFHSFSHWFGRQ